MAETPPFDIRPGERYTDSEGRVWELTDHGQWKEYPMAETVDDRLSDLANLQPGWDSYGGVSPDPLALRMARIIATCTPTINPSGDGAVLLRWHGDGVEIELWLEPGMSGSVVFTPAGASDG